MPGYDAYKGSLLYENPLSCAEDLRDFVLEGRAVTTFPEGRMLLENAESAAIGQKANYVLWCRRAFPADLQIGRAHV